MIRIAMMVCAVLSSLCEDLVRILEISRPQGRAQWTVFEADVW